MKIKNYSKIIVAFLLVSTFSFAQKTKEDPTMTITPRVSVKDYQTEESLRAKNKGELKALYQERFKLMIDLLPQIGFTFRPAQTLTTLGIPENGDTKKNTETYNDAKISYIDAGIKFQSDMLSYSDTSNIIKAILFYEEIIKQIEQALQN